MIALSCESVQKPKCTILITCTADPHEFSWEIVREDDQTRTEDGEPDHELTPWFDRSLEAFRRIRRDKWQGGRAARRAGQGHRRGFDPDPRRLWRHNVRRLHLAMEALA